MLQTHFVGTASKSDQSLWLLAYGRKGIRKKLFKIVAAYRGQGPIYHTPLISILWIVLDERSNWSGKLEQLDMQSIYLILNCLQGDDSIDEKQDLLIDIFSKKNLNLLMARILLSELIPKINNSEFEEALVKYYVRSSEVLYLHEAKRLFQDWMDRKNLIFKQAEIEQDTLGLIQFLIFTEELDKASRHLTDLKDWKILVKVAGELYAKDPDMLKCHYIDTLSYYLSTHFGSIAIETVEGRITHIMGQTTLKYANQVRQNLMSTFPQRTWS